MIIKEQDFDNLKTGYPVKFEWNGYNISLTPEVVLRGETQVEIDAVLNAYNKFYRFRTITLLKYIKDSGSFNFMLRQIGKTLDKEMFKDRGIIRLKEEEL